MIYYAYDMYVCGWVAIYVHDLQLTMLILMCMANVRAKVMMYIYVYAGLWNKF